MHLVRVGPGMAKAKPGEPMDKEAKKKGEATAVAKLKTLGNF